MGWMVALRGAVTYLREGSVMRNKIAATMLLGAFGVLVLGSGAAYTQEHEVGSETEAFTPGEAPGEYRVETEVLHGVLGEEGISPGLHPLVYAPDDTLLTGGPYGIANHYRMFTTNHRYDDMHALESDTTLEDPDTLRVHWPSAEDRPFALTGIYRWVAPGTFDLETIVEAEEELPDFEVFLASYLSSAFPASAVYAQTGQEETGFITAEQEEGVWQVFPRDGEALAIVQDGRWEIPPSPVDWAVRPDFAEALIYRRAEDSDLTVAMMGQPEDCFALFSPERGEGHYSMYLSLFGRTIEAGETASTTVRVIVDALDEDALLERYQDFLDEHSD